MKKAFLFASVFFISNVVFAKKVMFSVDMDTIPLTVNGIQITGDFQDEAGFPTDWDPATTAMTKNPLDTSVYSIVVDIPAFRKYEFKFVNGIFGYEVEFVPYESRVLYQFNDNRWVWVDSLSNDTQLVQPVIFSQNAPVGKHLLRFRVDMRNIPTVSPNGVHVVGAFQGWDTVATYMYTFDGAIHEYIAYVDTGFSSFEHEFKYFNGNAKGDEESVPLACANPNSNRGVYIASDSILEAICFASCVTCAGNNVAQLNKKLKYSIYPNPSFGTFDVQSLYAAFDEVKIYNMQGTLVLADRQAGFSRTVNVSEPGIYFLKITSANETYSQKVIVQ